MQTDLRDTKLFKRIQQADADWLQLNSDTPSDLYDIALSPDGRTIAASGVIAKVLEEASRSGFAWLTFPVASFGLYRQAPTPTWHQSGHRTAASLPSSRIAMNPGSPSFVFSTSPRNGKRA